MAGEKILVVDDNEAGRYVKARILERAGYAVTQAATGKEALDLVAAERPSLVLLDVSLPDMSGIEVCRTIKAKDPALLVLQTSAAFTGKHDRAAGLVGGADSYLVEPLEPEELTATVEALLRLHRAEQELRASHESLERQVDARTSELADANEKLKTEVEQRREAETILRHAQRMDVLGQLTGGIAHDFNNLLAIILGNLEMLRRRLGPGADPKVIANADNAFFGARRAAALTRQLLSFSRRKSMDPKPIRLDQLMTGVAGLLRQTLTENVQVEVTAPAGLWPVHADEGELEAAILNLAVNARDAMDQGGKLTVSLRNDARAGGDMVAISVADTGRGMSEKVRKYAFEPFFTTKEIGEGTGLGLSQVYGFVTQAGGRAEIDSTEGVGTTVTLFLPRYTGPISDEAAAVVDKSPTTILVLEDNDHVRAQTMEMIRELGYRAEEVSSVKAALGMLAARPDIGLLFSDVGLPGGVDGAVFARDAVKARPGLKVLLTSGYAPSTAALQETHFPILAKPFTFAGLGRALRDILIKEKRPAVVFVEDEPLIRMNAVEILREHGFDVEEAGTAAEARAILARKNGDAGAAVIDIGLPDKPGDDLAAEFRATHPNMAIIIASGARGEKARIHFAGDPLTAFADKPYNVDSLAALLRKLRADL